MLSRTLALYMKADCGTYATCIRHVPVSAYVLQGMGPQCTTGGADSFDSLSNENGRMVSPGLMLQLFVKMVISVRSLCDELSHCVADTKR